MNLQCRPASKADVIVCSDTQSAWAFSENVLWQLPKGDRGSVQVTAVYGGNVYGQGPSGPVVLNAKTGEDVTANAGIAPTVVTPYAGVLYNSKISALEIYPAAS